ncbi:cobaltochelatase CobN [Paraburkholderia sp. RAU6.4a]
MHLLRTTPGGFVDDTQGVIRIDQQPAEIVVLSSADTTLSLLASVVPRLGDGFPSVRLANVTYLRQPASVDFYLDDVLQHARVVVVDHLGGETYWPYGIEQVVALAQRKQQTLAMFSGDLQEDPNLLARSTASAELCQQLWRYLREGGPQNAEAFLRCIAYRALDWGREPDPPRALPAASLYHPERDTPIVADWQARWRQDAPVVAILFYKAHLQAANTAVFDALIDALEAQGLNPLPLAITSLKDAVSRDVVQSLCAQHGVALVLNTTAFAASAIDDPEPLALAGDAPVFQVILSGGNREDWLKDNHGLNSRDIAMHIALPEVDGRIITRAISFKGLAYRCAHTQVDVVRYQPDLERVGFLAELSRRWCRLRSLDNADKKVALILANYPMSEGRIGNGVGLDTPASVVGILSMLRDEAYRVGELPENGDALLNRLTEGVTNDPVVRDLRPALQSLALDDYLAHFNALPASVRDALNARWGKPEQDPTLRRGRFMIAGWRCGQVFVGIQPARSREHGDYASYHDAELVPPHAYLAFYFWLRHQFGIDAVVHVGKHGNLEWLPGKSVALSDACWPDLILGPMPHLYPFIVNDPGEGSQAKRRAQAVIIDHLMPPLTRAENYGPLQDLERQVDEYYEALMVDSRRAKLLRRTILTTIVEHRLHEELSLAAPNRQDDEDALLTRVDAWLCELKEAQIRDGLHTFGQSPRGVQRRDTLLALGRFPVGDGRAGKAGLVDALARDLRIDHRFDPLTVDWAAAWDGPQPEVLQRVSDAPWRHYGDTRERLELLAGELLRGVCNVDCDDADRSQAVPVADENLPQAAQVIARLRDDVLPRLDACGPQEMTQLKRGLEGRFVPPGPSGSPSRGRPDVLPTGRNFYSVDTRAVPTQAAWALGLKSAQQLIERHLQEHGDYPPRDRPVGLGHRDDAHRRRRYRAGARAARRAAEMGAGQPPCDGLRDHADRRVRSAAYRRHVARIRFFSRCVRERDASVRCGRASGCRTRRARGAESDSRARAARTRCVDRARHGPGRSAQARRLARVQRAAGHVRRGSAADDRLAPMADRRRSRERVSGMGRICVRAEERGRGGASSVWHAPRSDGPRAAEPGQPRARRARFERLLPVSGRHGRGGAASGRSAAAGLSRGSQQSGRAARADVAGGDRARDPLARGQSEMARRREAPRLQGRGRDRRDRRLSVWLRRDRARDRGSSIRARRRCLSE